ncbi:hypothetical protein D3C80_1608830 [compost metagenome]
MDLLAFTCLVARVQSRQYTDRTEHAAHDVVHRTPRTQRLPHRAGHVGEPAHHLHDLVQGQAIFVRAFQEAFVGDIDKPSISRAQCVVVQPEFGHAPGLEILDEHVGGIDQGQHCLPAGRAAQVERNAFLVAVEYPEKPRTGPGKVPCTVPFDRLHLDHFSPQVCQQHAACRPHHHMRQLDDTDTFKR